MCGIAGFVGARADMQEILQKMTDRIAHRGPDGEGHYIDGPVALGHRRLSIIDLEGGRQPMFNEDGSLAVVFNGEIYNFQPLREELIAAGHTFATRCDTEVLLHGYEQWGRELLTRLRGMFTFALWDKNSRTLFCARDHFGIKPLYYYIAPETGTLLFGSEIKCFLDHPEFKKELNADQLELYLSYQYSPGEDTFFKGVKKLLPRPLAGVEGRQGGGGPLLAAGFCPDHGPSLAEWEDAISAAMKESVAAHKIADVEVGSFLSSGVDSSYMAALAHVDKTFTVGFADKQYDETDYAREFSKRSASRILPTASRRRNTGQTSAISSTIWTNAGRRSLGGAVLCQPGGRQAGQGLPVRRRGRRVFRRLQHLQGAFYRQLVRQAAPVAAPGHRRGGRVPAAGTTGSTFWCGAAARWRNATSATQPDGRAPQETAFEAILRRGQTHRPVPPLFEQTKGQDPVTPDGILRLEPVDGGRHPAEGRQDEHGQQPGAAGAVFGPEGV